MLKIVSDPLKAVAGAHVVRLAPHVFCFHYCCTRAPKHPRMLNNSLSPFEGCHWYVDKVVPKPWPSWPCTLWEGRREGFIFSLFLTECFAEVTPFTLQHGTGRGSEKADSWFCWLSSMLSCGNFEGRPVLHRPNYKTAIIIMIWKAFSIPEEFFIQYLFSFFFSIIIYRWTKPWWNLQTVMLYALIFFHHHTC